MQENHRSDTPGQKLTLQSTHVHGINTKAEYESWSHATTQQATARMKATNMSFRNVPVKEVYCASLCCIVKPREWSIQGSVFIMTLVQRTDLYRRWVPRSDIDTGYIS